MFSVQTFALSTPRVSGFAIDSWIPVSRFVVELPSLAVFSSVFLCNKHLEMRERIVFNLSIKPHL